LTGADETPAPVARRLFEEEASRLRRVTLALEELRIVARTTSRLLRRR